MSIKPFNIINPDGSTNEAEYNRCIEFLNSYINGEIKVYPKLTWDNPVEIDMSRAESAYQILTRYLTYDQNKLLTKEAFENIVKLFKGLLERYGSTIHSYGKYLEQSQNFTDGPGYMYDVFTEDETRVSKNEYNADIDIYYLEDENHTVLEYNDKAYTYLNLDDELPTANVPTVFLYSNVVNYPGVYKGNLCGVYSDFQRLAGQYVGSSTLFYYGECNDQLYTTSGNSYTDNRIDEVINFNYRASVSNKSRPTRGVDLDNVQTSQDAVQDPALVNAYLPPSIVNPSVNYLTPIFFTSLNETDWK